jgi:hypothetical protein
VPHATRSYSSILGCFRHFFPFPFFFLLLPLAFRRLSHESHSQKVQSSQRPDEEKSFYVSQVLSAGEWGNADREAQVSIDTVELLPRSRALFLVCSS